MRPQDLSEMVATRPTKTDVRLVVETYTIRLCPIAFVPAHALSKSKKAKGRLITPTLFMCL